MKKFVILFLIIFPSLAHAELIFPSSTSGNSVYVTATGSTQSRALSVRFADQINMRDWVSNYCDGSTDNATSMNAAISYAHTYGISSIYFPPSPTACMLGADLTVPSGLTLYAQKNTVTLKAKTGNSSSAVIIAANSNDTIDGLTIDGGGSTFGSANNVVVFYGTPGGSTLKNSTIQNTRGIGIIASTAPNTTIINNTFNNIGNYWITSGLASDRKQAIAICCGTQATNTGDIVSGNYLVNVGLDAISVTLATDVVISNNTCELSNNQYNLLTATAYGACIYTSSVTGLTATGNISNGASGNAFDFANTQYFTVSGNYAINSGQVGVNIGGSDDFYTVTGNTVLNSNQWSGGLEHGGFQLFGTPGTNGTFTGNLATDNQGTKTQLYGIYGDVLNTYPNIHIDASNIFTGNLTSAFGGSLTGYSASTFGGINVNTPAYSDTGILGQFTGTVAGYDQVIIQNTSNATNASANLILNNDLGSSSSYAELGINSSTFTGSGSLNLPSAMYLDNAIGDLVLGTLASNAIHFVVNGGTTDAAKIGTSGKLLVGSGAYTNEANDNAAMLVQNFNDTNFEQANIGFMASAQADPSNAALYGFGIYGHGYTNNGQHSAGIVGEGFVTNTADTGSSMGVRGYANAAHAGGINVGLYGDAANGASNYALYMNNGGIYSASVQTWTNTGGTTFSNSITVPSPVIGAADSASPSAQTISTNNVVTGTSNTAGSALTIQGSKGTGTGTGGALIFQTAPAGSSGTTQNTEVTQLTIASGGGATFAQTVAVPTLRVGSTNTFTSAAATISSGFGTSPSVSAGNATIMRVNVGTGGTASTGTLTMPTATNGWNCVAQDVTTPATNVTALTGSSTTSVTFTNYSRTTGLAAAWTSGDVLAINCGAY